jgi:hypothetical protein
MKLMTAVKRLKKDFGMVGVEYRVKTWEMYQPVEFWLFTDKYLINVLPMSQYRTDKGFYLNEREFSKEQVDHLATKQPFIRIEISPRNNYYAKSLKFRVRNAQSLQNILDKVENDPKYKAVFEEQPIVIG